MFESNEDGAGWTPPEGGDEMPSETTTVAAPAAPKASKKAKTSKATKKEVTKMAKTAKTAAPAPAKAAKPLTEKEQIALLKPEYRDRIVSVAATNPKGKPTRVVIACQFEGCKAKREIATQDLFQVKYCSEHQRVASRASRRKGKPAVSLKEHAKATAKAAKKGKK